MVSSTTTSSSFGSRASLKLRPANALATSPSAWAAIHTATTGAILISETGIATKTVQTREDPTIATITHNAILATGMAVRREDPTTEMTTDQGATSATAMVISQGNDPAITGTITSVEDDSSQ